jgi:hypothetical protein
MALPLEKEARQGAGSRGEWLEPIYKAIQFR